MKNIAEVPQDILEKMKWIADVYGYEAQSRQCIEEMAELTMDINKKWRKDKFGGNDTEIAVAEANILGEMADVIIMLWQLKYLLGFEGNKLEEAIGYKVNRQVARMEGELPKATEEHNQMEITSYENMRLTPEQMRNVDEAYLEMCKKINALGKGESPELKMQDEVPIWKQHICPVANEHYWPKCIAYNQKTGRCRGTVVCDKSPYRIKKSTVHERNYYNARKCIDRMSKKILGENYHNKGMNDYTRDIVACGDIINEFNSVKAKMAIWRAGFWLALVIWIITSIF